MHHPGACFADLIVVQRYSGKAAERHRATCCTPRPSHVGYTRQVCRVYPTDFVVRTLSIKNMETNDGIALLLSAVGKRVRALRLQAGQNQTQFAQMVGISRQHLSDVERGKANSSLRYLGKIANGINAPITIFFAGMENDPPCDLDERAVEYAFVKLPPQRNRNTDNGETD